MSDLLEKIRSRGYWHIVVRPGSFIENRVGSLSNLKGILERSSVRLRRSWSFPHVSDNAMLHKGADWIGQEIDLQNHLEMWRFYQSGQFVYFGGLVADWSNESDGRRGEASPNGKKKLGVLGVAIKYAEVFEFAARLSRTEAGDDAMHIEVSLRGIQNHELWTADFPIISTSDEGRKVSDEFSFKKDVYALSLLASSNELAFKAAVETFKCFGWKHPNIYYLRDLLGATRV